MRNIVFFVVVAYVVAVCGFSKFNHWQPISKQKSSPHQILGQSKFQSDKFVSSYLSDFTKLGCPYDPKVQQSFARPLTDPKVSQFIQASPNVPFCPVEPQHCQKSKYRTLDGSCNNPYNPSWGAAVNRYGRLVRPIYSDGVSTAPLAKSGNPLPNARIISLVVFDGADVPDPEFTLANMQWGQIVTHDMSRTAGATQSKASAIRCCGPNGQPIPDAHPSCFPILPTQGDPIHSKTRTQCLNFLRTQTDRDRNCEGQLETAEQLTVVTAYLDLSEVYGSSDAQLQPIRAFLGGRMLVDERWGQEWPPQNPNASTTCDGAPGEPCYLAGDGRANQNPGLTIIQIILLREHNLLADGLRKLNPHWNDETLFQEARRINTAQYQHITYWEWLPIMLGEENVSKNRLLYNDYDHSVDPSVLNEHATAAFRYFHSAIEGRLDLISEAHSRMGSLRLSDWFNRPVILETDRNFDFLAKGLVTQPEQLNDINFDPEITHFLFRNGRPFGLDLRAIDVQRNRDHGLATYNDLREFCGFPRASKWEDYQDLVAPEVISRLRSVYESHEDVDLTVGASLESHVRGALAGPTFLCIMTEQFYRTRVGDRYFYEHSNTDVGFSSEQLREIRKGSMARLFCNNVKHIYTIQPEAFRRVSIRNQLVPCNLIPRINLLPWQDHGGHGYQN